MKKIIILFIMTILNLRAESGSFVKDIRIEELNFSIPEIKKEKLTEDISYYSKHSENFPITYLQIHIEGGEAITSGKGVEIPAILAYMLKYGGTKQLPEEKFISQIESYGATFNVSSEYDKLILKTSFLSRDQNIILSLIEGLFKYPTLSQSSFETAKNKLIEQIKRRNDNTQSLGFRKGGELLYRNYKAGDNGSIESIQKIKRRDIYQFWKESIRFSKKSVVVTGMFEEEKLKLKLAEILTHKKVGKQVLKTEELDYSTLAKNLNSLKYDICFVDKKVNQTMVVMMGVLPPHNHKDFYAIQLLNYIIGGGGFVSYFMQQIRVEKGLAYSASSYPIFKKSHGSVYFYSLTKNETTRQVYDLMKDILSEKTFINITQKELDDAKNAITNQFVFLFTNDNRIAENQLRFDEDEMPKDYLQNYRSQIQGVSLEDIRNIGKKYFQSHKLKTLIVGPADSMKPLFKSKKYIVIDPEEKFK
ncbi:MAG: insulinase family protein [Leptospiraceae bacterium]|nr:insulinase family protein [Leptospiraceae bacterium]MCP5495433.1 insulinase family protein [Leptospiraceae bacterium]